MNTTFKFLVNTTFRSRSKMGAGLRLLLSGLLFTVGLTLLFAEGIGKNPFKAKGEIKPRPTHGQLHERRKDVQTDGKIEMAEKPIKMKKIRSGKTDSLINRSVILSHGKFWTFVPRESILHIPPHLASRVNGERKGTLLNWRDFHAKNRTWLHPQEVSLPQARGETPITEESVKVYKSVSRVVVAVCHGGPISVKPPKEAKGTELAKGRAAPVKPVRKPVLR